MSAKKTIKKKSEELTAEQWKEIAAALYRNVMFAVQHFKSPALVATFDAKGNLKSSKHWKEVFADSLEMWPGVKVDREVMHALSLPKKQREKALKEIEAERAKKKDTP
jgi:hypothetical protein